MEDSTSSLIHWLKVRSIELKQLIDIEMQQKKILLPRVNELNEILFLYKYEDILLNNLEQLCLLKIYIDSEAKIENYDFFSYVSSILTNVKESASVSVPHFELYPRRFHEYFKYLQLVIQEINKIRKHIEEKMQEKYENYLNDIKTPNQKPVLEYSLTTIAEKFSIKCSGHLGRLSLLQAYEQDWRICKTCHAFICPTCAGNLNMCPNLAGTKHELELIGLPLENIINFLQSEDQRSQSDENFIRMDQINR